MGSTRMGAAAAALSIALLVAGYAIAPGAVLMRQTLALPLSRSWLAHARTRTRSAHCARSTLLFLSVSRALTDLRAHGAAVDSSAGGHDQRVEQPEQLLLAHQRHRALAHL